MKSVERKKNVEIKFDDIEHKGKPDPNEIVPRAVSVNNSEINICIYDKNCKNDTHKLCRLPLNSYQGQQDKKFKNNLR